MEGLFVGFTMGTSDSKLVGNTLKLCGHVATEGAEDVGDILGDVVGCAECHCAYGMSVYSDVNTTTNFP